MKMGLVRNLYTYRDLIESLAYREITGRYRQSFLGPGWAIIQPVALMLLFSGLRSFIEIPSDGFPYPIFAFTALLPWTLFTNSVVFSVSSVVQNGNIIRKIYFPREVFPTVTVLVTLFDFFIAFGILLILILLYRIPLHITMLLLPFLVLIQLVLALGVAYAVSALAVFRRDVVFGTPFVMQFWMYASPVIYPTSAVPERFRWLYNLNPMAGLIEAYRSVILRGELPNLTTLFIATTASALALVFGYWLFKSLEMRFADVV